MQASSSVLPVVPAYDDDQRHLLHTLLCFYHRQSSTHSFLSISPLRYLLHQRAMPKIIHTRFIPDHRYQLFCSSVACTSVTESQPHNTYMHSSVHCSTGHGSHLASTEDHAKQHNRKVGAPHVWSPSRSTSIVHGLTPWSVSGKSSARGDRRPGLRHTRPPIPNLRLQVYTSM